MDHVPEVGVTPDAGVGEDLVEVKLYGLGDDVGVYGQQDDERRPLVCTEAWLNFICKFNAPTFRRAGKNLANSSAKLGTVLKIGIILSALKNVEF